MWKVGTLLLFEAPALPMPPPRPEMLTFFNDTLMAFVVAVPPSATLVRALPLKRIW